MRKRPPHEPAPDSEFRRAVADVAPLPPARRAALRKDRPAPIPRQRHADERAALAESLEAPLSVDDALDSGEEMAYLRPGLPRKVAKDLRRGRWVVQDVLDLHGMDRVEAAAAVAGFLRACSARRLRCVRIVHGKGLGVLKAKLRRWLPLKEEVLAFTQAPAREGGAGAVLVLLKS